VLPCAAGYHYRRPARYRCVAAHCSRGDREEIGGDRLEIGKGRSMLPGSSWPREAGPRCRSRGSPAELETGHGAGRPRRHTAGDREPRRGQRGAAGPRAPPARLDDHSNDHCGGKGRDGAVWGRLQKRRNARRTEGGGTQRDAAASRKPSFGPGGLSGPATCTSQLSSPPIHTPNRAVRPNTRGELAGYGVGEFRRYHWQNGTGRERSGAGGTTVGARPRLS
jgi:hypothetical protein